MMDINDATRGVGAFPFRRGGALLLLLAGLFWTSAIAAVILLVPSSTTLNELSFGFGPYVREMLVNGHFADCSYASCDHASRMPLLPWVASALGRFSENQRVATILKDVILALLSTAALAWIWRLQPASPERTGTWLTVACLMVIGLPVAKHAGQLDYEEGLGIPLLLLLGLAAPLAMSGQVDRTTVRRLLVLTIVLGVLLYLLKASYLLVFIVTLLAAMAWGMSRKEPVVVVVAALALLAPIGWGLHNLAAGDRFAVTTSFDGENLHRGWNSDTVRIYPEIVLDRIFDSPDAVLPDGQRVQFEPKPMRPNFKNEWAWNDFNRARALAWIEDNPSIAAGLALRKAENYLFSLRKTPVSYLADARANPGGHAMEKLSVSLWLVAARLMMAVFAVACVELWLRRPARRGAIALTALLAIAYAVPMMVGFNYERHITAGLVLTLGSVLAIGSEAFTILAGWRGQTAT
jgi:hypothetical protein